jgi:hypothetical protein
MGSSKFHGVFAILILGLATLLSPIALSYLAKTITINSTGRILAAKTLITQVSEIRGVFIHEAIYGVSRNWTLIAETLANYGVNAVFVNDLSGQGYRDDVRDAIDAFHAKGIEYHSVMSVLHEYVHSGTEAITYNGNIWYKFSHCPIKAHDLVLQAVSNYLGNFSDVDGIMLDYIRYGETQSVCYCDSCKAAFDAWYYQNYGQHVSNWTLFYPGGQYVGIYDEWQTIPITQLVKDIHDLVKSMNPNIVISEAAWSLFDNSAIYWRLYLGQDTACWINEGYIDFVAPMMYTKEVTGGSSDNLANCTTANVKYWMGGQTEGPVPLVAFLRADWTTTDLTSEEFKAQVDYVRSRGLDGWIIFRYSGPGGYLSGVPNITDYLAVLDMPATFAITNINVEITSDSATITWLTTLPTISKVEYITNPLFNASWMVQSGFHFWNITYTPGAMIIDYANVTEHRVTITGLSPGTRYYFRIQSMGTSGTVTSKVMTFTTS